ncbi:hypothetical protein M758_12G048200 [Ceratodon purpureus]|nr:hypothetical protein M758_12G048200 [Ceratodon purpureus]
MPNLRLKDTAINAPLVTIIRKQLKGKNESVIHSKNQQHTEPPKTLKLNKTYHQKITALSAQATSNELFGTENKKNCKGIQHVLVSLSNRIPNDGNQNNY